MDATIATARGAVYESAMYGGGVRGGCSHHAPDSCDDCDGTAEERAELWAPCHGSCGARPGLPCTDDCTTLEDQ